MDRGNHNKSIQMKFLLDCKTLLILICWSILFPTVANSSSGPFFWTGKKGEKTLNILGTSHVTLPLEELQCSEVIAQKLDDSSLLLMEINEQKRNQVAELMLEKIQEISAKHKLIDRGGFKKLSLENQNFIKQNIERNLKTLGIDNRSIEQYIQSLNSQSRYETLFNLLGLCGLEQSLEEGEPTEPKNLVLDFQIEKIALSSGKPVQSLDDTQNMLRIYILLDKDGSFVEDIGSIETLINKKIQIYDKICTPEFIKAQKQIYESIKDGYIKGDFTTEKIYTLELEMFKKFGLLDELIEDLTTDTILFEKEVVKNRNERWMPKIINKLINENEIFISVGTGHLQGAHSLLKSLRNEGFTVDRLPSSCEFSQSEP